MPTTPMLVLFDIDETLVHTGGSGAESWDAAFRRLYDTPADIGKHTSSGETDPEVGRETFVGVLGRDPSDEELASVYVAYLDHLADAIVASTKYKVLPGARELCTKLAASSIMLGLVSGAMEGAARAKLGPGDLNRFFLFGAYGSDSPDRPEIIRLAIGKAQHLRPVMTPADVYVVGDTPHDIAAAKKAGAVAVGVASGHFSAAELADAGADHVLASLEEPFPGL